jgi:hypothetical protein
MILGSPTSSWGDQPPGSPRWLASLGPSSPQPATAKARNASYRVGTESSVPGGHPQTPRARFARAFVC